MNRRHGLLLAVTSVVLAGCHTDMWVQPKIHEPFQESKFYSDGMTSRPLIQNTVARGHLRLDDAFYTGYKDGKMITEFPLPVNEELIRRGQERYSIYCTPCHGQLGNGQGMIAKRGFTLRRPVGNYHTERLRKMPVGHFYDVITSGYGSMFSYASRVEPRDRWAIVAYIRTLQLSESASDADKADADARFPIPEKPAEHESAPAEGGGH
ncbi:MAG TPA: cytochrome c [Fimbriimonadaceae bacterium]|nr:cytochrome c [Fimbriimonadaceae bacterium]